VLLLPRLLVLLLLLLLLLVRVPLLLLAAPLRLQRGVALLLLPSQRRPADRAAVRRVHSQQPLPHLTPRARLHTCGGVMVATGGQARHAQDSVLCAAHASSV
jgi:hypothetical protein